MAGVGARVTTKRLGLPTRLLARLGRVLAFLRPMAIFLTEMGTALEGLAADLTTARVCQPARHIFQHPLAAQARLFGQERALRTVVLVRVAVMRALGVTTGLGPLTWESARRRLRATGLRRKQDRSSTITRDLLEDCFSAGVACTLVAEFRACVAFAFQRSTTDSRTDVLCFDILVNGTEVRLKFAPRSLTINCGLFPGAASLSARVAATVQSRFANPEALGWFGVALVADANRGIATASTVNRDAAHTGTARTSVADLIARVATWKGLAAWFQAVGDGVLARGSRTKSRNFGEWCFATGTLVNHVGRSRAMGREGVLGMAAFLA